MARISPQLLTVVNNVYAYQDTQWTSEDSSEMDQLRSPVSVSLSSFDSNPASQSPMSLGSVGSPQGFVFLTIENEMNNMILNQPVTLEPRLHITEQPQDKFRFRYVSEMHGTHGCILGVRKSRVQKSYPAVELLNFMGNAVIRCSLYTADPNHRVQHPHTLVAKIGSVEREEPHDVEVPRSDSGYIVDFQGIGIIHTARKNVPDALIEKKKKRKLEELGDGAKLSVRQINEINETATLDSRNINLNSVCLCFEAFTRESNGALRPLCEPVFSSAIHNMKSALTGELKICRIDKLAGSCKGGDEVFIFVEKVNKKNIKVRFFEVDEDGNDIWQDFARFNELDVHHQYAIAFRTPPFRDTKLTRNVEVFLELHRPSDGLKSECKKFTYKPQERDVYGPQRKRPRELTVSSESSELVQGASASSQLDVQIQMQSTSSLLDDDSLEDPMLSAIPRNFPDNYQSFTTPSFEQFLANVDGSNNLADYLELLENSECDSTVGVVPLNHCGIVTGNPDMVSDAAPLAVSKTISISVKSDSVMKGVMDKAKKEKKEDPAILAVKVLECLDRAAGVNMERKGIGHILYTRLKPSPDSGCNALHTAVEHNQEAELQRLLDMLKEYSNEILDGGHLPIVNTQNHVKQTPLYLAVLFNRPKMVTALLDAGANLKIEGHVRTVLQLAVELDPPAQECFYCLLKSSEAAILLDNENSDGRTILHEAVLRGNLDAVRKVIQAGANINKADSSSGNTALHLAVMQSNIDITEYLIHNRVAVDVVNATGNTPLHIACVLDGQGSPTMCKLLLDAKATPWLENNDLIPLVKQEARDDDEKNVGPSDAKDTGNVTVPSFGSVKIKKEPITRNKNNEDDEEEIRELRGCTPFDLAASNPAIMRMLHRAQKLALSKIGKVSEDFSGEVVIKAEPLSPMMMEDALDSDTLLEVAALLEDSASWKDLAQCMGLEHHIPVLERNLDPAKRLLAGCMGQISTQELRELLEALNQTKAVERVDAMLVRRLANQ